MSTKIPNTDQTTHTVKKLTKKTKVRTQFDPISNIPDPIPKNNLPVPVTPDQVQQLATLGCTKNEIAKILKTTVEVIDQYNDDFLYGINDLKRNLRRKQIEVALDGNPNMLIWLGKNLLGQTDRPVDLDSTVDYVKFEMYSTQPTED